MSNPFDQSFLGGVTRQVVPSDEGVDYAVWVGLPPRYADDDQNYPLLIVLDGNLCFGTAFEAASLGAMTGDGAPVIVVGVGTADDLGSHSTRRLVDYLPEPFSASAASPVMQGVRASLAGKGLDPDVIGRADTFLRFLTHRLLPKLCADLRVDRVNVGLAGHSAGGVLSCYAMLRSAASFSKFIIGSFGAPWIGERLPLLEQTFAEAPPRSIEIFHAVGGAELASPITGPDLAAGGALLARVAAKRGITITSRTFEHETHASVLSHLLSSGIRTLWPGGGPMTARRP
jgi:predicted alpha/beta superfamily hydrolase